MTLDAMPPKKNGFDVLRDLRRKDVQIRVFVETSGVVEIEQEQIVIHFDKRRHNPTRTTLV